MRDVFGGAAYIALVALSLSGAALAVGCLSVLLDRRSAPAGSEAAVMRAGRRAQLRRYGVRWVVLACVWLAGVVLLAAL